MGYEEEVIEYQPVNLDLPIAILAHEVRPGVVEISPPKLVPSGHRFYPVRCGKRIKSGTKSSARVGRVTPDVSAHADRVAHSGSCG